MRWAVNTEVLERLDCGGGEFYAVRRVAPAAWRELRHREVGFGHRGVPSVS
jgi:hypothetical protein